jgi:hypothetical protein
MFTTAHGARAGSARVAVLLTEGISKLESAKQEAKKLEGEGGYETSLYIKLKI